MISANDLAAYMKISPMPSGLEGKFLEEVARQATTLVDNLIRGSFSSPPAEIVRLAELETASKLKSFRDAPNGVAAWGDLDGAPVRLTSDALTVARKLLGPYMSRGFA